MTAPTMLVGKDNQTKHLSKANWKTPYFRFPKNPLKPSPRAEQMRVCMHLHKLLVFDLTSRFHLENGLEHSMVFSQKTFVSTKPNKYLIPSMLGIIRNAKPMNIEFSIIRFVQFLTVFAFGIFLYL